MATLSQWNILSLQNKTDFLLISVWYIAKNKQKTLMIWAAMRLDLQKQQEFQKFADKQRNLIEFLCGKTCFFLHIKIQPILLC